MAELGKIVMDTNIQPLHRVDISHWEGDGYHPFVSHRDWLVALMNWDPRFDLANVGQVERHNQTDEVFVLTHGRGVLFIATNDAIQAVDMEPGVIYNVTSGTWHSVIGTHETSWLIVESKDTSLEYSDYRHLTESEIDALRKQYPSWLR
jgi:mannose-6-phosphate isomerase-like protein (cupin superfamily)